MRAEIRCSPCFGVQEIDTTVPTADVERVNVLEPMLDPFERNVTVPVMLSRSVFITTADAETLFPSVVSEVLSQSGVGANETVAAANSGKSSRGSSAASNLIVLFYMFLAWGWT